MSSNDGGGAVAAIEAVLMILPLVPAVIADLDEANGRAAANAFFYQGRRRRFIINV